MGPSYTVAFSLQNNLTGEQLLSALLRVRKWKCLTSICSWEGAGQLGCEQSAPSARARKCRLRFCALSLDWVSRGLRFAKKKPRSDSGSGRCELLRDRDAQQDIVRDALPRGRWPAPGWWAGCGSSLTLLQTSRVRAGPPGTHCQGHSSLLEGSWVLGGGEPGVGSLGGSWLTELVSGDAMLYSTHVPVYHLSPWVSPRPQ